MHPSLTGYPEISDNVALKDTVINYELVSKNATEMNFNAIAIVTDVFGNDTSYIYQNVTVNLQSGIYGDNLIEFNLAQNYPNPFKSSTVINYTIKSPSYVTLKVYNLLGHEELELVSRSQARGHYSVQVDASHLTSGTYYYRLQAGYFVDAKKMILLK